MAILELITQTIDSHPILATFLCASFCLYTYNESKKVSELLWSWGALGFSRLWLQPDLRHIPPVGYSNPILSFIDVYRYHLDSVGFVQKGYEKFKNQAFKVPAPRRWVVYLNGSKYLEELRKIPEDVLSSREIILLISPKATQAGLFLGPNFAQNHYHMDIIRHQMTRKVPDFFPELLEEVRESFQKFIPLENDWKAHNPNKAILNIIAQSMTRVSLGMPHCRDDELIGTGLALSSHLHFSSLFVAAFPEFLQPYIVPFLPGLLRNKRKWLKMLTPIIEERKRLIQEGVEDHMDVLSWLMDEAKGPEIASENLAFRILLINHASFSTTTLITVHILYHMASELHYLPSLRQEMEEAIAEEGWTKNAMDKMHKLDSFIKETMRMRPISAGLVGHKAVQDYTFSDGTFIPKNTVLVAPVAAVQYDEANYPNAHEFQGFRFVDQKGDGDESSRRSFVSLTSDYFPFGHGNHACPGRFFAASSMKLVLTHLLINYDFMLEKGATAGGGKRPNDFFVGVVRIPNQQARLLFRKRQV
ncbi:cytochrome P450 [Macrolepiota fuliginosa MF-IS2]|uniref:Cytochrome P450 n=1 Tax=Macrolepiota fuliginosa MF-IS2 TaxID=1400762 RepID=A0A9P5X6U0_9AGAR|nr:cytochrome P450 [Macrolepiota fuliginosa MF-IS2]